jgi:hypothetical protein
MCCGKPGPRRLLLESLFLDNPRERGLLQQGDFRTQLAQSIAGGIRKALGPVARSPPAGNSYGTGWSLLEPGGSGPVRPRPGLKAFMMPSSLPAGFQALNS